MNEPISNVMIATDVKDDIKAVIKAEVNAEFDKFVLEHLDNVRSAVIDGVEWYVGADVAKELGFDSVACHLAFVDDEDKRLIGCEERILLKIPFKGKNYRGKLYLINENGLRVLVERKCMSKKNKSNRNRNSLSDDAMHSFAKSETNIHNNLDVTVFENNEFGKVRTVIINGEVWFVGKDVADALGYSNSQDALARHVDDEDKNTVVIRDGNKGNPNQIIINESGLYSLIMSSKLPSAKKFKRWATSEVLPVCYRNECDNDKCEDIILHDTKGQITVSSVEVAKNFDKRHDHVIRDIEDIIKGLPKIGETPNRLFIESTYQHPQNNQIYKYYEVTKDGFVILAMGFTGLKALKWKLKYINAFNKRDVYIHEMLNKQDYYRPSNNSEITELHQTMTELLEQNKTMMFIIQNRFTFDSYSANIWKKYEAIPKIEELSQIANIDKDTARSKIYEHMNKKFGFCVSNVMHRFEMKYRETKTTLDVIADDYLLQGRFIYIADFLIKCYKEYDTKKDNGNQDNKLTDSDDDASVTVDASEPKIVLNLNDDFDYCIEKVAEYIGDTNNSHRKTLQIVYAEMYNQRSWGMILGHQHCATKRAAVAKSDKHKARFIEVCNQLLSK